MIALWWVVSVLVYIEFVRGFLWLFPRLVRFRERTLEKARQQR